MFRILLLLAGLAGIFYWLLPAIDHTPSSAEQAVEQKLRDLNREVDRLQQRSQDAGAKARREVDEKTAALRAQIQDSEKTLAELRASSRGRLATLRRTWDRWFGPKEKP